MDTLMSATKAEGTNFFWHCLMAAKVLDEMPQNTVTRSYVLRAVRMASVCVRGRRGVQFASAGATAERVNRGLDWDRLGLIKEHVVPVSVICKLVRQELGRPHPIPGTEDSLCATGSARNLTAAESDLFREHPRAEQVARIVNAWTLLAWITPEEDRQFDDKARHGGMSLRSRMPSSWTVNSDKLARYQACGIALAEI